MDSPEREQIGAPNCNLEESSPFSSFANNLSPINAMKPNLSRTFGPLNFSSPKSIFTSPHVVNSQKEYRILKSLQLLELKKPELTLKDERRACGSESANDAARQLESSLPEGPQCAGISSGDVSLEPLCGILGDAIGLPMDMKYGCASQDCIADMTICSGMIHETDTLSFVPFCEESLGRRHFASEFSSHAAEETHEGTSSCWEMLISESEDLFDFHSPHGTVGIEEKSQKPMDVDTSSFPSFLPRFQDDAKCGQIIYHLGSMNSYEENQNKVHFSETAGPSGENQMHQVRDSMAIDSMNDFLVGDPNENSEIELVSNFPRCVRRRCLFEDPGARKNIEGCPISSSFTSLLEGNIETADEQKAHLIPRSETSQCLVPGIGLHLNALAVASKGYTVVNQEAACPQEDVTVTVRTTLECVIKPPDSTCLENEMDLGENKDLLAEEAPRATVNVVDGVSTQNSTKKKRHKTENNGEGEACKGCKCRKSKCLKLYCDCFAAGVYCMDSCACQDCFNKPVHAETVLTTRKQIESRNPLAFAPKVIRSSDATADLGDNSTTTPASARHKRGCSCKKSGCLKKYCECYQGGVGCSVSCRCEGCQNLFGKREEHILLVTEAEIKEKTSGQENSSIVEICAVQDGIQNDEQNSEYTIIRTPLRVFRSSVAHPVSLKGKPPRTGFSVGGAGSSLTVLHTCNGSVRTTLLRSEHQTEGPDDTSGDNLPVVLQGNSSPSKIGIKTLSPNSKRVSPPHHDSCGRTSSAGSKATRKLILQSIPSFPSLTPRRCLDD